MSTSSTPNAHFHSIADVALAALPDAVLVLAPDLTILQSTDQFRALFGLPIYAARPGASVLDVADQVEFDADQAAGPATRHPLRSRWQNMFSEAEAMDHVEMLADGRSISVQCRPLAGEGTLVVFSDVSRDARREAAKSTLAREHELVLAELSEVTLGLVRALDSPMRKITECAGRLEAKYADQLPEGGCLYLERVSQAADLMRNTLRDFRGYAGLTNRDLEAEDVALDDVIRAVLEDLRSEIAEAGANFDYGSLPVVPGDRELLAELFGHVFKNALTFRRPTSKPYIKIDCETRCGVAGRREFAIKIADNGAGFDPQHCEAVFGIFRPIGPDTDSPRMGFGLAACRKIARRHGGRITAETKLDVGTTITLTLPASSEHGVSNEMLDDVALLGAGGAKR